MSLSPPAATTAEVLLSKTKMSGEIRRKSGFTLPVEDICWLQVQMPSEHQTAPGGGTCVFFCSAPPKPNWASLIDDYAPQCRRPFLTNFSTTTSSDLLVRASGVAAWDNYSQWSSSVGNNKCEYVCNCMRWYCWKRAYVLCKPSLDKYRIPKRKKRQITISPF